jgi:hypothetical protein
MIIDIFGVGRSGTTALFAALQQIMADQLSGSIKCYYEPFLRDPDVLHGEHAGYSKKFRLVDSLSAEGIYNHTKLPLFITDPKPYLNNTFLKEIYGLEKYSGVQQSSSFPDNEQNTPIQHRLIKYIRASGRHKLIDSLGVESKSIFIIRNPLDVANSIKDLFSYYGGEFHKDDEQRFIQEVNEKYQKNFSSESFKNHVDSQLFYWFYMNKFAMESFSGSDNPPYVICYEEFFGDIENHLPKLLDYLGLDCNEKCFDCFSKPVGPISKKKKMHSQEFSICEDYLKLYFDLLENNNVATNITGKDITCNYKVSDDYISNKSSLYGLHGRAVESKLKENPARVKHSKNKKPNFVHVINPVIVDQSSDLYIAQPITFETMEKAKSYAEMEGVSVDQAAVFFKEDEDLIPNSFSKCSYLERSCLDFQTFEKQRKLPLLQDILTKAYEHSDADYVIYTNVDIALMPHFYVTAKKLMDEGYDAIKIFRRTLSSEYESVSDIPNMYADLGENHPGTDCFIMKRSLIEKIDLKNIVVGCMYVAHALNANLHAFSDKTTDLTTHHLTFHIGDDRTWANQNEYSEYNSAESDKMFEALSHRSDIKDIKALGRSHKKFKERKARVLRNRIESNLEERIEERIEARFEARFEAKIEEFHRDEKKIKENEKAESETKAKKKAEAKKKSEGKLVAKIKSLIPSKIKSKIKKILSIQ